MDELVNNLYLITPLAELVAVVNLTDIVFRRIRTTK